MALIIEPGPLPDDGTRIKIDDVLNAFVRGTRITNIGADALDSGTNFIISATDPPATNTRNRATIWYRRGEGKTYLWTRIHAASPNSETTNGRWVSISDRRDLLVKYGGLIAAGEWLSINTRITQDKAEQSGTFRPTLFVCATAVTDVYAAKSLIPPPFFVAQTGGSMGDYQVVVDTGFVFARMQAGTSGPGFAYLKPVVSPILAFSGNISEAGVSNMIVGHVAESNVGPVGAAGMLRVYKSPHTSNLVT